MTNILTVFFLILVCLPAYAQNDTNISGTDLVKTLRSGGYNIYFRHAATDWSQYDQIDKAGDWTSCDPSKVRQLSDEGRAQAKSVGEAMRALDIPVGKVLASPYCRAVETAALMALGEVETTTDIMNLRVADYFGGRNAIIESAQRRLATQPEPGTNTILVAHGNVAQNATPVYPGEGEGVIFQPHGAASFKLIGRLTPQQWRELMQQTDKISK